ncbi:hypothetical protein Bpfe_005623, partial [Biomphalaria pfeifferi]
DNFSNRFNNFKMKLYNATGCVLYTYNDQSTEQDKTFYMVQIPQYLLSPIWRISVSAMYGNLPMLTICELETFG